MKVMVVKVRGMSMMLMSDADDHDGSHGRDDGDADHDGVLTVVISVVVMVQPLLAPLPRLMMRMTMISWGAHELKALLREVLGSCLT